MGERGREEKWQIVNYMHSRICLSDSRFSVEQYNNILWKYIINFIYFTHMHSYTLHN